MQITLCSVQGISDIQGIIEILTEVGRHRGMEMNVEKAKVMRNSRQPSQVQKPENVEYLSYLCSIITNNARCTRDIKSRIVMAKAAFNKQKTFF
jgi:hypothetical protein